jgi:hypothetical protein
MTAAENKLVGFFDNNSKTAGDRLVVGEATGFDSNDYSRLFCFDEQILSQTSSDDSPLELLIPFGDSFGTLEPALRAVDLAKALGAEVCFYHTTWREPSRNTDNPLEHMCGAARDVLAMALHRCLTARVVPSSLIECADDIAQGVVRAALRRGSCLIVAAYGRRTFRGSYVDQVVQRSTVPVLVMSRQEGGT